MTWSSPGHPYCQLHCRECDRCDPIHGLVYRSLNRKSYKMEVDQGDGLYSTLQNPVHTYQGIGRFAITLEVENPGKSAIIRKIEFIKTIRPNR